MRERYNWAGKAHPSTCTCAGCTARRLAPPPAKKKNKPKSLRGKPKKGPLDQAADIFKDFGRSHGGGDTGEAGDKKK